MQPPAADKVALVTGAGRRRIGQVVAEMLASRGYAVALSYRYSGQEAARTVDQFRRQGIQAEAFQADVADEKQVGQLFRNVQDRFGRLDVLVTAAAIWEPKPLEEVTADDVRRHFEINSLGTFLCCQRAGLMMAEQPAGGAIVTIGDWATQRPYPDYAAYFSSKGTIPAITRMFAVELARRNPAVRVNAVLPGPVMLPDGITATERNRVISATLLKREGRPQHIGHAVLFLVENDYVTGVCLPVDGGRTIASGEMASRGEPPVSTAG